MHNQTLTPTAQITEETAAMTDDNRRVEEEHPLYLFLIKAAVMAFAPVLLAGIALPGYYLAQAGYGLWMLLLIPLGLLASDFTSGLFHWFFDNYGTPQTPVFGQTIELFRVHHDLPQDICKSNFTFTVGHVCVWSVPMIAAHLLAYIWIQPPLIYSAWTVFFSTAHMFLILTNQFHKWAHLPEKPEWMLWMQKHRLVLDTPHHEVHHTPPYESYYCITTGWMNPLLFKIRFFPRMEALLAKLGFPKASELAQTAAKATTR